jgi:CRISPR-associated protein Cst2
MSKHLFGLIVTPHGVAANNRGENEGNITTLQKILWSGEVHTTVSAEAIRFAIRWYWQAQLGENAVNRAWDEETCLHKWTDAEFTQWTKYIDDDVLGFMSAKSAKEEGNDAEKRAPKPGKKARGTCDKRRARLEVTRAISMTPFAGDITFNAASPGATPSASSTGRDPVPYGTEVHATRYQYAFALTPEELHEKKRALDVVDAIINLSDVAGNHARFLFDFSPDSIIFRWTDDFAPRMLYGFALDPEGRLAVPEILRRVEAKDIDPKELVVGGGISGLPDGAALKSKGALVFPGVREAAEEIKKRMKAAL